MTDGFSQTGFGPVELDVISLDRPTVSPALLHALAKQVDAGVVQLLDLMVVARSEDGETIETVEIDPSEFGLGNLEPLAPGLAADEDVLALASQLPPGGAAAVVALELVWARELAAQLAADNSFVVATERIPAPVVNAIVELTADL